MSTLRAAVGEPVTIEVTADGHVRLPAEFALAAFPHDRCAGLVTEQGDFVLLPVTPIAPNGLIMKQRTLAGERSVLIREVWSDDHPVGVFEATWMPTRRRLVLSALPAPAAPAETGGIAARPAPP